jgi:hypothetical protein
LVLGFAGWEAVRIPLLAGSSGKQSPQFLSPARILLHLVSRVADDVYGLLKAAHHRRSNDLQVLLELGARRLGRRLRLGLKEGENLLVGGVVGEVIRLAVKPLNLLCH